MHQQRSRTGLSLIVLLGLALTAGLGLGLFFGWVVWPVRYVDTSFADLAVEQQEQYIVLVGAAYARDRDLDKARERLVQLDSPKIEVWVANLADRYISEKRAESDIQALVELAHGLGVDTPRMVAYLATPTPLPTDTPLPTSTPTPTPVPTDTPVPTETPIPPTDTPPPPTPTDTARPNPTATAIPPTHTARPQPTNPPQSKPTATPTKKPAPPTPTNTPKPPAAKWSIVEQRLVGPGEDAQTCESGNLQIRVMVIGPNGNQLGGVWVHDVYSGQDQVTGNVDSPDWGPGETKFEYGQGGGGKLCITSGQGGSCESPYTRDMPCFDPPPFEDVWAAGYCSCCGGEAAVNKDVCRQIYEAHSESNKCVGWWGHYSWRVVFKRNW